ncbi:fumarylacetoacetate hydrolase family protein [Paenibacillus polymyxa]|uniref:Fumarylacetoacetate hydrolase n=1 Tax=Paenibacillus polymyxa (strain SC2) TaxID=886882 RepID=E3EH65_PAEPS|nr:fumarylacetoacetate hydrolase family protein [Paenibacillus polymyxa]ADO55856.1 fumarylacetoacetate hydrolase [Paenibacillus polymyxa SC2]WPQ58574.1 fumarylacetoacetate hydrolase family protein [Paenibacillus polymyxa]CCC84628.1 fumarylacetoacetate hydrolase domain-containing protein 1 [Paenibacillus polymyxa M1]
MNVEIRNVYCVGRNYKLHAEELGNEVPTEPMIFLKPSHAVVPLDGAALELPQGKGDIHFETELVVAVGRNYEPGMTADACLNAFAFGIDFTLRDVQSTLKKKGHPWTAAKGFKSSAPVTPFLPLESLDVLEQQDFSLFKNGQEVQRGHVKDMIFSIQHIVEYIATQYGLGKGDIIFTGTPAGVGPTTSGDHFELYWGSEHQGSFTIG